MLVQDGYLRPVTLSHRSLVSAVTQMDLQRRQQPLLLAASRGEPDLQRRQQPAA